MTAKERVFARHYGQTGDATYSADRAGYAHPKQAGHAAAQRPDVLLEARKHAMSMLKDVIMPANLAALARIAESKTTSDKDQITLFKAVAPYVLKEANVDENVPLAERTPAELDRLLVSTLARLDELRRPPIDITPEPLEPSIFD